MKVFKNIIAFTIITLSVIGCLAKFNSNKPLTVCNTCGQAATAASISEAEDFSLVNLLTLKFM